MAWYRSGYNGGAVDDVIVNGESVVDDGIASVTVPTKLSELLNDGHYLTDTTVIKSLTISNWITDSTWEGYTQTINVTGILATNTPMIGLYVPDSATTETIGLLEKTWSLIKKAETSDGTITFYASKQPTSDILVLIKGIG